MLEIIDKRDMRSAKSIDADEIPFGTVFYGEIRSDEIHSGFFGRHHDIVQYSPPGYTWDGNPPIHNYQPVDARLTILRNAE